MGDNKLNKDNFTNGYNVLSGFKLFSGLPDIPEFSSKFPWYGSDLQTLASHIRPSMAKNLPHGKRVLLRIDEKNEALAAIENSRSAVSGAPKPTILLLHGLGGDENSIYMREAAEYFRCLGHTVLRINLRGSGLSARTSHNIYHAGISEDLRSLLSFLPDSLTKHGVFIMGFSLGGNVLLKFMGDGSVPDFVKGAVSVSAPIDLKVAQHRIAEFRNRPYRAYLLRKLKRDFTHICWKGDTDHIKNCDDISSIIEFDDKVIAPIYGFKDAYDYYEKCSSKSFIRKISKPTLMLHANTDPWILPRPYKEALWCENENVCTILSKDGGHVGFNSKNDNFPWYLKVASLFMSSLL